MKSRLPALFSLLILALAAVSCAPTREQRIEKNAAYFQTLSPADQTLVREGKLRIGMPKEAVLLSLGRPDQTSEIVRGGQSTEEVWAYLSYRAIPTYPSWPALPVHDRCGRVVYYQHPYPEMVQVPYVSSRVMLRDHRVSGWEKAGGRRP
ncbi:MAG: hypothetical protein ACKO2G_12890 [Verrucomicrobiales bacterium]